MRIDFLGLEAFLNIAELGSFRQAAARLNLSQTALSHRMKKLEDDLGLRLLVRTTRQVSLTPAGLEFLPKAQRILDELSLSFEGLRAQGRGHQERIAIGCLPTIAVSYLPRVLGEFSDLYPRVSVKVFDNSALEIAELVQSDAVAFAITLMATTAWDVEAKPLFREPFVLLCPAAHPFAQAAAVSWSQLEDTPLVRISRQAGNRGLIDAALGSRHEALDWRYEVQHVATAVGMVLAGVGLSVVPRLAVDLPGTPGLVAVPLRDPGITRSLGVIQKRGLPLAPASQALQDMIIRDLWVADS